MRNTLDIMRDLQITGTALNAPLLLEAAQAIAALNAENNALTDKNVALMNRLVQLENPHNISTAYDQPAMYYIPQTTF